MAKIVSFKQLISQFLNADVSVEHLRQNRRDFSISSKHKVVLVTGCFDLFHQAHKDFLRTAKKQGDVLIIGLESDKRVKQLKGKGRPINSWQKRAEELAQLKGASATFDVVDFIFPLPEKFNDLKDHFKLLQLIKPKILAVSKNTPYLEKKKKLIKKVGGKLFVFPFNSRYSTTRLLDS